MNNSKNIWKGVRKITECKEKSKSKISLNVNNKAESDPLKIANHFNEYFTSTATDQIRAEIRASEKSFKAFLKNNQLNSFFLTPYLLSRFLK